ncbi:hypothetical protein ACI798_06320 [Geodermatophilus sp. SYSU D01045]
MSLLVLHLRWNDVDPEQYEVLRRALPEDADRPPRCLSRRHVRQPRSVMVYEVWDDARAAEDELGRIRALLDAGPEQPQRVVFVLPDVFAPGFARRPARPAPAPEVATVPVVPAPRQPESPVTVPTT